MKVVWFLLGAAAWTIAIGRIFYRAGYVDGYADKRLGNTSKL